MRRFARWLKKKFDAILDWVVEHVFVLLADIPGLPFMWQHWILNDYLRLAAKFGQSTNDTYQVTAMVELTIKPWMTLRRLRDILAPQLTFD